MLVRHPILRFAAVGALALPILPAIAPAIAIAEESGGLRMRFGLEQRLEYTNNLALELPPEGATAISSTRLSFGLSSETRTERLALDLGAALKLANGPDSPETGLGDPRLDLSYAREAANARFSFGANYRKSEVDFLRPLEDFTDDAGVIVLPEDIDDLTGTGDRTNYAVNTAIELGTAAPLGLALSAGLSGLSYTDVSNPNLVDIRRARAAATVKLRFSETSQGRIGLDYARYEAEDAEETLRETTALEAGLAHDLSARAVLDTMLGYSIIDTEEFGITTRAEGLIGRIGLDYAMPNGSLTSEITAKTNQDGTRLGLSFGRSLDLPAGALAFTIGVTRPEGGETAVIGSLFWLHETPDGQITARVDRKVSTTNEDAEKLTTLVALGYDREITALSGLTVDFIYAVTDGTGTDPAVDRGSLTASYRHALTADWSMNFGLALRMREEAGAERAESQSVFVSLRRDFDF